MLDTAITLDMVVDGGACEVAPGVMGLDVTKTVIWLGPMALEAGI